MASDSLEGLDKWLGITTQQYEILKTIHKLQLSGQETSPKNIASAYGRDYGKLIQTPNLFHVMHALTIKNLIRKGKHASYELDLAGIRAALDESEIKLAGQLKKSQEAKKDLDSYLQRISGTDRPEVTYLDEKQFFDRLAGSVSNARTHYMSGPFPKLFYPQAIQERLARYDYLRAIKQRCFNLRDLEVHVITDLNTDFLYSDVRRFAPSEKEALRLASAVLDQIRYYCENYDNLKVHYCERLVGMDYVIPVKDNPKEIFIYMRDESGGIIGGIYVNSQQAAGRAHKSLTQFIDYSKPLEGPAGRRILNKIRKSIKGKILKEYA